MYSVCYPIICQFFLSNLILNSLAVYPTQVARKMELKAIMSCQYPKVTDPLVKTLSLAYSISYKLVLIIVTSFSVLDIELVLK